MAVSSFMVNSIWSADVAARVSKNAQRQMKQCNRRRTEDQQLQNGV